MTVRKLRNVSTQRYALQCVVVQQYCMPVAVNAIVGIAVDDDAADAD